MIDDEMMANIERRLDALEKQTSPICSGCEGKGLQWVIQSNGVGCNKLCVVCGGKASASEPALTDEQVAEFVDGLLAEDPRIRALVEVANKVIAYLNEGAADDCDMADELEAAVKPVEECQ